MNIDIRKEEFLNLCEALEKGIITIEQFKILSDLENKSEMSALINIMETAGLENKDILFENILKQYNIEPVCATLKEIFTKSPIYKIDIERQNFIFQVIVDNFNEVVELSNLFSNDIIWNNKKFVDKIMDILKDIHKENYGELRKFNTIIRLLNKETKKNLNIFEDEKFLSLSYNAFKIKEIDEAEDYLESIKIENIRKEKIWSKYLHKASDRPYGVHPMLDFTWSYKLKEFDDNNRLSFLTKKIEEIDTSNLSEREKEEKFIKLTHNVINIDEEIIKEFTDDNFKYLIDQAAKDEKFYETKELLEAVQEGKITLEEAKEIKKKLEKISWSNVRSMALYTYLDDKKLLSDDDFKSLENCSYDKAKLMITKLAIEKGNDKYKNEGITYFGEKFSKTFIEYLNTNEFTKEEILELRDKILSLKPKFVPHKKTFVVDTSSIVEEVELTEKEIEKEIAEEKFKKMVKRRKEERRKWENICAWLKK